MFSTKPQFVRNLYSQMWILRSVIIVIVASYNTGSCSLELARGKHANASSNHHNYWNATNTVDGNTNTNIECNSCLHTREDNTAYLRINLGEPHSIKRIKIYFVEYGGDCHNKVSAAKNVQNRSKGYTVHLTSRRTLDDQPCFRDNTIDANSFQLNQTVTCVGKGQYVTISQTNRAPHMKGAILMICEVKVYGCLVGYYGENCSSPCGDKNCYSCDPDNGTCWSCLDGWYEPDCTIACQNNTFGKNCNQKCGNCRNNTICNKENGTCPNFECAAGYEGTFCKTMCSEGEYGENCNYTCGQCKTGQCDKMSGYCPNLECEQGYEAPLCKIECRNKTYGYNCNETCGPCRDDRPCDKRYGNCTDSACDRGFNGTLCKTKCKPGTYGYNCNETCGSCRNRSVCDSKLGQCPKSECDRGYKGSNCKTECDHGTYGYNCQEMCGNCKDGNSCDKIDGTCSDCEPGYNDTLCEKKCPGRTFGYRCSYDCGSCRFNKICNHEDGTCPGGLCDRGVEGDLCDKECGNGTYGYNCQNKCGKCRNEMPCDPVDGKCPGYACAPGYEGSLCLSVQQVPDSTGPAASVIAGSSFGVIAVILVAGATVIILRRRQRGDGKKYTERGQNSEKRNDEIKFSTQPTIPPAAAAYANMADVMLEDDGEDISGGEIYANLSAVQKDINSYSFCVNRLQDVIKERGREDNRQFQEEFAVLPKGPRKPFDAGTVPENRPKNRFKSTFPYDGTRIILKDGESDYINASYITDLEDKKAYIASQGPKDNTIVDMWQMVWQENVSVIVMLTNLVEKQAKKCAQYWPNHRKTSKHGRFTITNTGEKLHRNYTVRTLKLQGTETKTSRHVRQYHYTAWPDHGVPQGLDLILFYERVRRAVTKNKNPQAPMLVHCSAGIGRTGTFIALDALLRHSDNNKNINVFQYILHMREEERMNMIQTLDQYIAIYCLLYDAMRSKFYPIPKSKLQEQVQMMCDSTLPANQNAVRQQYTELDALKPRYTDDDYRGGLNNLELNIDRNILPVDRYRLFLNSYVKGRSDYINAVSIPSQRQASAIIVTNFPAPENAVDVLRLLVDHGTALVILGNGNHPWFPVVSSNVECEPFTVQRSKAKTGWARPVEASDLTVINKRDGTSYNFKAFSVTTWPTLESSTSDLTVVLDLIKGVMAWMDTNSDGKVVVMSSDGLQRCDVFCAVYNAIEQLELDEEVDMFNIARQLQVRRPQFFATVEEYKLSLQIIACEASDENVYANT